MFKGDAALATHSCSLGAPILIEEMKAAGVTAGGGAKPETPACDEMRKMGLWNTAWDQFYDLSPLWTEDLFAFAVPGIYNSGIFTAKFIDIKGAVKAGATPEEIMTVLQICVSMGVQACAKGVPILAEELERQ